jgi:hypothetical protein
VTAQRSETHGHRRRAEDAETSGSRRRCPVIPSLWWPRRRRRPQSRPVGVGAVADQLAGVVVAVGGGGAAGATGEPVAGRVVGEGLRLPVRVGDLRQAVDGSGGEPGQPTLGPVGTLPPGSVKGRSLPTVEARGMCSSPPSPLAAEFGVVGSVHRLCEQLLDVPDLLGLGRRRSLGHRQPAPGSRLCHLHLGLLEGDVDQPSSAALKAVRVAR